MKRFFTVALICLILLIAACAVVGYREARTLQTTVVEIVLPRLPSEFDGFRILLLSDLHLFNDTAFTEQLARRVAQLHADIAVIAGDFMGMHATEAETVSQLRILLPAFLHFGKIYGVAGNQDSRGVMFEVENLGVRVLRGEREILKRGDATLGIAGLTFPFSAAALSRCLQEMKGPHGTIPACQILVAHSPDIVLWEDSRKADLILSGHTHGGQIRLPGIGALITRTRLGRRYDSGLFLFGKTQLFITRGVGTTYLPVRLFCPPEIVLITLRGPAKSKV